MDDAGSSRALLVVTAWFESGAPNPLRAELRRTVDVATGLQEIERFTDVDAVCDAIRQWLADMSQTAR